MYLVYGDFKDLARRAASDKVLRDLILLKSQNIMDIKEVLLLSFMQFLIKNRQVAVSLSLKMKLNKINNLQMNFINQL